MHPLESAHENETRAVFTTLGMFIIDEFRFDEPLTQIPDQIGGGGTYAATAAAMFLPPSKVGMIIDRGSDWSPDWQRQLNLYGDIWVYRDDNTRLTTKARATYCGETRGFEYLTSKRRISPPDFVGTRLEAPEYLHFVCSPTRALEIIGDLDQLGWTNTKLVYEPIPFDCLPRELPALRKVLPRIHYFSPNHEEAGTFFGRPLEDVGGWDGVDKKSTIEALADQFYAEGAQQAVIIRSGKMGAYIKHKQGSERAQSGYWLSPYYTASEKVVDVTGAGNAFLGGLIAGAHLTSDDVDIACLYGSVASSYTIEQYGLPSVDASGMWNSSDRPLERLNKLIKREGPKKSAV